MRIWHPLILIEFRTQFKLIFWVGGRDSRLVIGRETARASTDELESVVGNITAIIISPHSAEHIRACLGIQGVNTGPTTGRDST